MGEEVKLFGVWGSAYCRRVELALKLKGVEFEYFEEDLHNKSDLLLKYNPIHQLVPVLLHNGNPIAESLIILEYIDDTWKQGFPILPKDPYERAIARFWASFIDEKCKAAVSRCWASEDREKAVEEAHGIFKILENELKGKKFFGGDDVGYVDIVGNWIGGYWLKDLQEIKGVELLTREKLPKLCEWSDRFVSHAVIKETLPPRDEMIALFRSRFG